MQATGEALSTTPFYLLMLFLQFLIHKHSKHKNFIWYSADRKNVTNDLTRMHLSDMECLYHDWYRCETHFFFIHKSKWCWLTWHGSCTKTQESDYRHAASTPEIFHMDKRSSQGVAKSRCNRLVPGINSLILVLYKKMGSRQPYHVIHIGK